MVVENKVQCSQMQGTQPQHGAGFSCMNLTLGVHGITALNKGADKQCFSPIQKQDRSNSGQEYVAKNLLWIGEQKKETNFCSAANSNIYFITMKPSLCYNA